MNNFLDTKLGEPHEPDPFHCAACGSTEDLLLVQYVWDHPDHYDGVSEIRCPCGARTGRWSGRVLEDGASEPRYGGK